MTGGVPLELEVPEAGGAQHRSLTPGQLATLLAARHLVDLTPLSGGAWRISGKRRVGLVRVGAGLDTVVLNLRPKLPIASLLFLLTYAPGANTWQQEQVTTGTDQQLLPAIAEAFARAARRALDGGVLHGYRNVAEQRHSLRGRLDAPAQIRSCGLPLPVAVRYDEFTADIPENQILAAALTKLAELPQVPAPTRATLRHLSGRLVDVSTLTPGSRLPAWTPNRLNARYAPALRLAALILANQTPDLRSGTTVPVDGIVIDLEAVFEHFLATTLDQAARPLGLRSAPQDRRHRLDTAGRVKIRPDITIYRNAQPITVIDAKYKTTDGLGDQPDLYQITAYCTALGLAAGHLVYADGPPAPTTHRIGPHGTAITVHGVDLTRTPPEILRATSLIMESAVGSVEALHETR